MDMNASPEAEKTNAGTAGARSRKRSSNIITEDFIHEVKERLRAGKRVRRNLPIWGRLHIDRQLPFLCVYRQAPGQPDIEAAELVVGGASYLLASGEKRLHKSLSLLVQGVASVFQEAFGSFLLLEVWLGNGGSVEGSQEVQWPNFRIHLSTKDRQGKTVSVFEQALHDIRIQDNRADVEVVKVAKPCPAQFPPLLTASRAAAMDCHVMGIEVNPVFRDPASGQLFPMVHKALRRRLAAAYKKGLYDFTRRHTTHRPPHYHALGPRAMVKAVWSVDAQLASVSGSFDLLLAVTPTNAEAAWRQFRSKRFERMPDFGYRPLPMDPALLKRQLYKAPIERVEDPTLADLFSEQQLEIDRKISLLAERGTPQFIYTSQQLYGPIDDELLTSAREILDSSHSQEREKSGARSVDARSFAARAKEEIDYLKLTYPGINSRVEIRDDIVGLMVSRGNLLIGSQVKIPAYRVPAAIAHEVGTHIVTYINGLAQPFRQLSVGLPGYEELQEGLAVFAEYLVGGLTLPRLRLLAARVVAARMLVGGASFVEVFRELDSNYGFTQRTAYQVTLRIFRGGGLTKDAIYLRGMLGLMKYLQNGGTLDMLYTGKFDLKHLPIIQELQLRHVLGSSPLRPSYLDLPDSLKRIEKVRSGLKLSDLTGKKRS